MDRISLANDIISQACQFLTTATTQDCLDNAAVAATSVQCAQVQTCVGYL